MKYFTALPKLISLFVFISCKEGIHPDNNIVTHDSSAVVKVVIPDSIAKGKSDTRSGWLKQVLGLQNVSRGYNGFQFRIYAEAINYKGAVLIIKDSNGTHFAELINYQIDFEYSASMKSITFQHIQLGNPKSGWKNLMNELEDLGFKKMPNPDSIPEFSPNADEVGVDFELVENKTYWLYSYPSPYYKEFSNNKILKNIKEILELLEREFQIDFPRL
ncbi:MAG TPA: hypothetical protein VNS32_22550 [Flavisolibacter sp.]|nr:hypothetical protein [Flavisolibacter sp.]